jgi:SOS-response transcriptional repressor LexA
MPRMLKFTPIHTQVYDFILKFKTDHDGIAPSVLEIGKGCGISSTSAVRHVLNSLDLFGMIKCDYGTGKSRMISIPGARWMPPLSIQSFSPADQAEHVTSVSGSSTKA